MILASWNVNSIGVRLPLVIDWLKETKVDVLCIQETKCVDEKFPKDDFLAIGYQSAYFGQKTYNGVAIVSRSDIAAVETNFPGIPKPEQARFVKAEIESVTILNSYIPNGSILYDNVDAVLTRIHQNQAFSFCGHPRLGSEEKDYEGFLQEHTVTDGGEFERTFFCLRFHIQSLTSRAPFTEHLFVALLY